MLQNNQGRKRRSTFSNIVSLETHGFHVGQEHGTAPTASDSAITGPKDRIESNREGAESTVASTSANINRKRPSIYYQISGDDMHLIDDADDAASYEQPHTRRISNSSLESQEEMLDHRNKTTPASRKKKDTSKRYPPRHKEEVSPSRGVHEPYYSSGSTQSPAERKFTQNMIDRWVRRRSSVSRQPLISGDSGNYDQLSDQEYAIAMDDNDNDNDNGILGSEERRFVDILSEEEPLDSEPSSRRNSDASSLNDVCFPVDSNRENDSVIGDIKIWPDLNLLSEFAEEEAKEIETVERQLAEGDESPYESGTTKRSASPFVGVYATVNEAEAVDGRLRPKRLIPWASYKKKRTRGRKQDAGYIPGVDDKAASQFRFAYFREDMEATIHSPNISGLVSQPGMNFAKLFPPRISNRSSEVLPPSFVGAAPLKPQQTAGSNPRKTPSFETLATGSPPQIIPQTAPQSEKNGSTSPRKQSASTQPSMAQSPAFGPPLPERATPYDTASVDPVPFWLDVCNPTEDEMKVIAKAFGIHPLTTEDIFTGENREKVELFRNYYFVCFRSVDINAARRRQKDHDERTENEEQRTRKDGYSSLKTSTSVSDLTKRRRRGSADNLSVKRGKNGKARTYDLKPMNMYIIVFHEGLITFHFSQTPHPMNVRRRTRLLQDYMTVSSDWISYALIDDIVDGFAPMIEAIEEEVNNIEDAILRFHSGSSDSDSSESDDYESDDDTNSTTTNSSKTTNRKAWRKKGDMLRRIGECRRRVMSLLRLLSSKPDVIRGFSKRCNERWEVAPRNEIGLYLGDIQDHVVTMVQSLNHYEKLLARSHSNYLAQINIDMTKVNNDLNDVLSKITVLGTLVLPMNIVTGLWGMNVIVPGQGEDSLVWFWSILAGMGLFAAVCFFWTRRYL